MQEEVSNQDPNTFVVYTKAVDFPKLNWMQDVVHYNQQELKDIGKVAAIEILNIEKRFK